MLCYDKYFKIFSLPSKIKNTNTFQQKKKKEIFFHFFILWQQLTVSTAIHNLKWNDL